jgi:hypothetical protein
MERVQKKKQIQQTERRREHVHVISEANEKVKELFAPTVVFPDRKGKSEYFQHSLLLFYYHISIFLLSVPKNKYLNN